MAKPAKKKHKQSVKTPVDYYRYANWFLILLALICYLPVLNLDLTQLDDSVFINDKHNFISHFANIPTAFVQGCFNEKDIYYRPVLVVYFILLNPLTSAKSIAIYHFGSIVFHVINVLLLFILLSKLTGKRNHSFWLTALFCIHPAFTMAVAWIPGINDLLLTTFALGYFLSLIRIAEGGTLKHILVNLMFLLLALFTKESGAFLPFGGVLLLIYLGRLKEFSKKSIPVILLASGAWVLWFFARKNVLPADTPALINTEMVSLLFYRAIGLIQYFGKCILPFNLGVFPTIESTNTVWGLAAIVLVALMILQNPGRNWKNIIIGTGWFVLFLLPIFFVPKHINDQLFEHRLYMPMIGILLLLRETVLFSSGMKSSTRQAIVTAVFIAFIADIHLYMPDFNDTFSFWNNAVACSPENAYANKMLGIKMAENKKERDAIPYIRKAYELDSTEKYTQLFLARLIFMPEKNWDSARYYLERETTLTPKFSDNYAELARVCVAQNDLPAAEKNVLKFLKLKPRDQVFNNNLLLLYKDQGKYSEAMAQADSMRAWKMEVNAGLYQSISDSVKAKR